ncbi:hypothetical protein GLYMA_12G013450v4 [Glycine max]|nr:hypothetical protein GLYMA_12G013450v4 [Glycine max]KAH1141076.1 hypothetical protein GYH30_032373 [Glycine max]
MQARAVHLFCFMHMMMWCFYFPLCVKCVRASMTNWALFMVQCGSISSWHRSS